MPTLTTFRITLRGLARTPVFALTAILTLALGIGMSTAMYAVVRDVLLAPLPYTHPERLVAIAFQFPGESPSTAQVGTAIDFLRHNSRSFASLGAAGGGPTGVNLATSTAGGTAHAFPVQQLSISHDFLATLGIQPLLGRNFTAEEDTHDGPRAALLSFAFWQSHFNADPHVLGHLVRIDGADVPVVGVLPPNAVADLLGPSREAGPTVVFQPLQMSSHDPGYEGTNYQLIARLRDGVSLAAAQAELDTLVSQFGHENPWFYRWHMPNGTFNHFGVWPLQAALTGDIRSSLLAVLGAVLTVLLVACLNLAGLTVARTTARTRELAVRAALGASRFNLLRLSLTETALLALPGALGGVVVARVAQAAFVAHAPLAIPQFHPLGSLLPSLMAAAVLTAGSMLVFGLVPALLVLRRDPNASLRLAGSQGASPTAVRSSRILVVAQITLAFLLLSAASLLWSTFLHLRSAQPGIRTDHLTVAQVTLKGDRYTTTLHNTQFIDQVLDRLSHQPGVSAAAAVNGLPLDRGLNLMGWPVGRRDDRQLTQVRFVTPTYLRSMGIDLLSGRSFTSGDTVASPHVAIISQTAAHRFWPGRSPLGERINTGNESDYEVVGVARDTHEMSLIDNPGILIYVPLTQIDDRFTKMINGWFPTTFVVRAADGVNLAPAINAAVAAADPDLPVTRLTTMNAVVNQTLQAPQFLSWLSGGFAGFTLLLTAIGLFGLLSYQVTARTREIAVRMAVGATRGDVLTSYLVRALTLTATGLALGLSGALLLPRLLNPILATYIAAGDGNGVTSLIHTAQQLETTLVAIALLLAATLAACALPIRRATNTEPALALRSE